MADRSIEREAPPTPWRTVQKKFFESEGLDVVVFSGKYGLDERAVRMVFGEQQLAFWSELCVALSRETGEPEQYFADLSYQYENQAA